MVDVFRSECLSNGAPVRTVGRSLSKPVFQSAKDELQTKEKLLLDCLLCYVLCCCRDGGVLLRVQRTEEGAQLIGLVRRIGSFDSMVLNGKANNVVSDSDEVRKQDRKRSVAAAR